MYEIISFNISEIVVHKKKASNILTNDDLTIGQ